MTGEAKLALGAVLALAAVAVGMSLVSKTATAAPAPAPSPSTTLTKGQSYQIMLNSGLPEQNVLLNLQAAGWSLTADAITATSGKYNTNTGASSSGSYTATATWTGASGPWPTTSGITYVSIR